MFPEPGRLQFVYADLGDANVVNKLFSENAFDVVMHFAAVAYVGESTLDPLRKYGIQVIIDLHAAPGSQNGNEHRATRDGSLEWAKTDETVQQSVDVINFLASRYLDNKKTAEEMEQQF
ncbi:putative UDP-arabinose 4-epimerase 2 [Spinacia oleracea]|uniref:UDP-arabinose 4-epimerase 2 n=1 Tax=Spinacia oleracea TaxID=3562 RepID=A0ABM3QPE2_SPIOL|nr:putative UDP-arabinose 4-epimerase 2 [Spinacia oleracea]